MSMTKKNTKIIKMNAVHKVCKFQNYSVTYILREINFLDSRSAKSAILTHLEANLDI